MRNKETQPLRRAVLFSRDFSKNLRIEVAQDESDFLQALRVLHDGYVERKVMEPVSHRYRVTRYHLLPTTTTVIAKFNNEIVATISLFLDGPMGLPMDQAWDLSFLRHRGQLIGEVSSLAMRKDFRRRHGKPLIHLMHKYILHYVSEILQLDALVLSTGTRIAAVYSDLFRCRVVDRKEGQQAFRAEKALVGQYLDLKEWKDCVKKARRRRFSGAIPVQSHEDMVGFCSNDMCSECLSYPSRDFYSPADPAMSSGLFDRLLHGYLQLRQQLTSNDIRVLEAIYRYSSFDPVLNKIIEKNDFRRSEGRCLSGIKATIVNPGPLSGLQVRLVDVSMSGAGLLADRSLPRGESLILELEPFEGKLARISGQVVSQKNHRYGFQLDYFASDNWARYVVALKRHFHLDVQSPRGGALAPAS